MILEAALGEAIDLLGQNRHAEMERVAHGMIASFPDAGQGWKMLALACMGQGRLAEARDSLEQGLRRTPGDWELSVYLGDLAHRQGDLAEAAGCYRQALARAPDHAALHYNLALLLQEAGRLDQAEEAFRQAIRCQPDFAEASINLASLLKSLKRYREAEAVFRQATGTTPAHADLLNNLGNLLKEQQRPVEAEAAYRQALALHPQGVEIHNNLGNLHKEQKRFVEAESAYRQALTLQPEFPDARWNLSLLCLSLGRFREGWSLHDARFHPGKTGWRVPPVALPYPMWRGERVTGRSLLIVSEQGFGDLIQFGRYLPLLKAGGARLLTLVCPAPLAVLCASLAGVDRMLAPEELGKAPEHDFWTFLLSIPVHLDTTLATIPARLPYLSAPPERLALWRDRAVWPGFRVGLAWRGNPAHANDANRSLPGLSLLAPLWDVPGISFVTLQLGPGEEEGRTPPHGMELFQPGGSLRDFADTAALVMQLDLVIGVDSAVVHLAGALGKPFWVLLPWNGDWRWLEERADSPWYPGLARLFRQHRPGDWSGVVRQVTTELRRLTGGSRP
ncbi:MAG: glycosyltransferase family protein [Magnetococcales bacterium]|nr:glycosyltransferase family protein [Magnetococcales bacterium]